MKQLIQLSVLLFFSAVTTLQAQSYLQMVTRFLAGIVLSYGAINQMERAERQILLDYALSEVDRLYNDSYATLTVIRETSYAIQRRRSLFQYYIDRDKELAQDILKNVKSLGI